MRALCIQLMKTSWIQLERKYNIRLVNQEYTTTDSCYGTPTWFQIKEKKKIGLDKTENNNKR